MFQVPLFDLRLGEDEVAAVAETLRSGWLSSGPATAELEREFAAYTGAGHAVALSSGTAALHLAYITTGLGEGNEVAMPSLTFVATANAAAYAGARPRFVEIADPRRPWLAASAAASALQGGAGALVNVAYGGRLGETAALAELARQHGVPLIEDAAHACGSWAGGRHAGCFGTVGALSFFANKNLGIGEGGMLVTDDEAIAARARTLRSHGMSSSSWQRHQQPVGAYEVGELGFNYRMDEPHATLARHRLRRLDDENGARARVDAAYRAALEPLAGVSLIEPAPEGERPSFHLFTVVLGEGIDREAFRRGLAARGVESSVHYRPVHDFDLYREPGLQLPVTDSYAARTVSLPIFPQIEQWQQELVIEAVVEGLEQSRTGRA